LVLSSTLLAHPRCQLILGWPDVPLAQAAAALGDWQLDHVLTTLAGLRLEARSNLLLLFAGDAAQAWRALPFRLVNFDAAAQQRWGLRRLSIQPLADGRCAVVAHSSHAFAADHLDVVGSRSAMAKLLQLPVDSGREDTVVQALSEAVVHCLAPWIPGIDPTQAAPQLMRWGAAFPLPPGLPAELMVCAASRVAFCGDFIAGDGFGRVEGALRSAENLGRQLVGLLDVDQP
jgi:predicted NAD/FAD-dependent oxidoreductase